MEVKEILRKMSNERSISSILIGFTFISKLLITLYLLKKSFIHRGLFYCWWFVTCVVLEKKIWVMLWEYVVKDSYHLVNILKYVLPSLEDC